MIVSNCGAYLVCAGSCCNIAVFKRSKNSWAWSHLLNLPKYKLAPTAIALRQNSPKLVAAFSDSKVKFQHTIFVYTAHSLLIQSITSIRSLNITWRRCVLHVRPTRSTSPTALLMPSTISSSIQTTRPLFCCTTILTSTCWKKRIHQRAPKPQESTWNPMMKTAHRTQQ